MRWTRWRPRKKMARRVRRRIGKERLLRSSPRRLKKRRSDKRKKTRKQNKRRKPRRALLNSQYQTALIFLSRRVRPYSRSVCNCTVPFFPSDIHAPYAQTLLRERDINPLHPWDTSLPLFISDPRYVLLPSVSARREAFDEYCRERAREIRASRVKKEKEDPKKEFENLLTTEVKSTRMSWNDFRRQWKKDRRSYGWGRDDREREKRFREFLRELGESASSTI